MPPVPGSESAGGDGGVASPPVGSSAGLEVDSVGSEGVLSLGDVDGSADGSLDGFGDFVELRPAGRVDDDGSGSGLMSARGSVPTTTAESSGAEPAAPPLSWLRCVGPCSEVTAGGRTGDSIALPNCAPNHIAGPSPTATMAPKSAIGPRSISAPPPWLNDDDLPGSDIGSTQFVGPQSKQRLFSL